MQLKKPLEVYLDAAPWGKYPAQTPTDYFDADSEVRRHLPWYQCKIKGVKVFSMRDIDSAADGSDINPHFCWI